MLLPRIDHTRASMLLQSMMNLDPADECWPHPLHILPHLSLFQDPQTHLPLIVWSPLGTLGSVGACGGHAVGSETAAFLGMEGMRRSVWGISSACFLKKETRARGLGPSQCR